MCIFILLAAKVKSQCSHHRFRFILLWVQSFRISGFEFYVYTLQVIHAVNYGKCAGGGAPLHAAYFGQHTWLAHCTSSELITAPLNRACCFVRIFSPFCLLSTHVSPCRRRTTDPVPGAPSSDKCSHHLSTITSLCGALGIPLAEDKLAEPTTELEYLGILLDSVTLEDCLPGDKLQDIKAALHQWIDHSECSKRISSPSSGPLALPPRSCQPAAPSCGE